MKNKKVIIIGAGFSSLASACYLAKYGFEVTVLEKNAQIGGRARQLKRDGFTFDIGPTFYWMPDVFERFFEDFNHKVSDFYELQKLSPAYQVYYGAQDSVTIGDSFEKISATFESIEKGSAKKLEKFMANAENNYNLAIKDLVYQPGEKLTEIVSFATMMKLNLFIQNVKSQVSKVVENDKLRKILEFPVLFLGAKSKDTPAFYNFMNYADFVLGTWQPKGGMYQVIESIEKLALSLGVKIHTDSSVNEIVLENNKVVGVKTVSGEYKCDILVSGADYAHTETLLPAELRQYSTKYWGSKKLAPSALLFYVGFDKKLKNVAHHTLCFDSDFEKHEQAIYDNPEWPKAPLFYTSFPSITSEGFAPEGNEAGIFLIPIAPDIIDTPEIREKYFKILIERLEFLTGEEISSSILFKESYCVNDFVKDYNSFKGNAYGLANTLFQTHFLRPKLKSKKVSNLYFTGQLTVPGPGVPPSLISGKIVSDLILKYTK